MSVFKLAAPAALILLAGCAGTADPSAPLTAAQLEARKEARDERCAPLYDPQKPATGECIGYTPPPPTRPSWPDPLEVLLDVGTKNAAWFLGTGTGTLLRNIFRND